MKDWLIWQLADSAYPAGGFAHSGGLEAAWQQGELNGESGLADYMRSQLTQVGHSQLPFVLAAHRDPDRFCELDRLCHAFLSNHVANRASRRQGGALLASSESVFPFTTMLRALRSTVTRTEAEGHFPPIFGVVTRALGVDSERTGRLFLFLALRGLVSSAVRLGAVGPLRGQFIQHRLGPYAEQIARRCGKVSVEDAAHTAPLLDVLQATQDRLYSRLFQS